MKKNNIDFESPVIKKYIELLHNIPQLSHEECIELFKKNDSKAKEQIAKCNLRLVVSIAKKYNRKNQLSFEDLIQEGNLGLLHAIDKFEWEKGTHFSTYATWWIRQSIGAFIASKKRLVRLPGHALAAQKKMLQITDKFVQQNAGSQPTENFVLNEVGVSDTVFQATKHASSKVVSLSSTISPKQNDIGNQQKETIEERLIDESVNPFDNYANQELLKLVKAVLKTLTPLEERILRLRFGIAEQITNTKEYSMSKNELNDILEANS